MGQNEPLHCDSVLQYRGSISDDVLAEVRKNELRPKIIEAALLKMTMLINNNGDKRELLNLFKEAVFYAYDDLVMLPFRYEMETVRYLENKYSARRRAERTVSVNARKETRQGARTMERGVKQSACASKKTVNGIFMGYFDTVETYVAIMENDTKLVNEICKVISIEMKKVEFFKTNSGIMHAAVS